MIIICIIIPTMSEIIAKTVEYYGFGPVVMENGLYKVSISGSYIQI